MAKKPARSSPAKAGADPSDDMSLSASAYSPPPGTSALVIGAAFVLLGSAMAMVTRWPIYKAKSRKAWLEKWGLRIAFVGAVAAVWGAAKPMWESGKYPVASGVLFAVALAMSGLLLAPLFLRGPPGIKEEEAEEQPSDERQSIKGAAVTVRAGTDPQIGVEGTTESEADLGEPPKVHSKPG
jgi:hypothetical protein